MFPHGENLNRNIPVQPAGCQPVYNKLGHRRASAILYTSMVKQDRTCLDGLQREPMKCLWPVVMTYLMEYLDHRDLSQEGYKLQPVWTIRLPTKCTTFGGSFTPTTKMRGESFYNDWLTNSNNASSTSTLRSNDLVKGWENHPPLPSPINCGWEFDTTRHPYPPVRCLNPPAPVAVMNLVKCGCKRGCKMCRYNNLPRTDVCGCVNFRFNNHANSDDSNLDVRKFPFSQRTINVWNKLST